MLCQNKQTYIYRVIGIINIILVPTVTYSLPTMLRFRAASENTARRWSGCDRYAQYNKTDDYTAAGRITPTYMRSFKPYDLTKSLFGTALYDDNRIAITGTARENRNPHKDIAAEHMYLSSLFAGEVRFTPSIEHAVLDNSLVFGLNSWSDGLYMRINAPLVWTKWNLNAQQTIHATGKQTGATGYEDIWNDPNDLLASFFDYSCLEHVPQAPWNSTTNAARRAYPLTCAKICPCSLRRAAVADLHAEIGRDVTWRGHNAHIFVKAVAPTGTRPDGTYLFEPIVGNGKHWELGGGISGQYQLWQSTDAKRALSLDGRMQFTHMFATRQRRVFDLKEYGPLSRYMQLFAYAGATTCETPYCMTPAANLTCRTVQVSVPVQCDSVLMATYTSNMTMWQIGYNLWIRSCEKIACVADAPCSTILADDDTTWAPKSKETTIHTITASPSITTHVSTDDLAIASARTRGISHKLFTYLSHQLTTTYEWTPYFGIGIEGEFGQTGADACCTTCACSHWGVWINGGTTF